MKIKINDVFGFQKAINFDKLNDPETLNQLSKMFNIDNQRPETVYKKAVSNLKSKEIESIDVARKRKYNLKTLKKQSPSIPDFTCGDIDKVIRELDCYFGVPLKRVALYNLKRKLGKLRKANDRLRQSGVYWYEIVKDLLSDINKYK